jgi:hypothetical protein
VTDRRNAALEKNAKRVSSRRQSDGLLTLPRLWALGEGGGDDDQEGKSEDEDEDVEGTRLAGNGLETKRRKQRSAYVTSH